MAASRNARRVNFIGTNFWQSLEPDPSIGLHDAAIFARPTSRKFEAPLTDDPTRTLAEPAAKALLTQYGVRVPRGAVAKTAQDIATAAASLTPPLALKIIDDAGGHKSDIGGVALGLESASAAASAAAAMPATNAGFLLEEMAPAGVEIALGGFRHHRFGPVLMVAMGGILVELLDAAVFRICPITQADAEAMLAELKGAALLDGFRGKPPADRPALIAAMLALGGKDGLLLQEANLAEFDVNPLIVSPERAVAVDARASLSPAPTEAARPVLPDLARLLQPNAVAVAGASASKPAHANGYIRQLKAFGFKGPIYPVHPTAATIEDLPAYPSLAALPEPVDYAYLAVGPKAAPGMLESANGRVQFAQTMASGFDAAARDGLAAAARAGGARLLGPNCLGVHAPAGQFSFMAGADDRAGGTTVLAQSGGLSLDILRRGARRGLRYRAVVTMGDCADLGPADLLPWFLDDPETETIGLYLEDAPSGRALFEALLAARGRKPVVLLAGGRTGQGARAAMSHTGALASDGRIWDGIARQTGAALTDTLDGFLDALGACQTLRPNYGRPTRRVVLFGNGGGAGVLAADAFSRAGLDVGPLPDAAAKALAGLNLPAGSSAANPIDVPGNVLQRDNGTFGVNVAEAALATGGWDAFVMHMNVPGLLAYEHVDILGPLIDAALAAGARGDGGHVALVLRSDGEPEVEAKKQAYREAALAAGVAVFDELPAAAEALSALAAIEAPQ